MAMETGTLAVEIIDRAEERILALLRSTEDEIGAVASGFEDLAHHAHDVLMLSAAIVECVEGEGVSSILPKVQSLGGAAQLFIHERLTATAGILETVVAETQLLERLALLTRGQKSIARETQTLSVLTSIEVARLGQLGAGFQYLAHELDDFSQSVTKGTKELAGHTEERRASIEETRRRLTVSLPKIQKEFVRLESDLGNALQVADASQRELLRMPAQFQACVEEISNQIAGVVAAVQSHDITRQQLEHVQESLTWILAALRASEEAGSAPPGPKILAGLAIQVYQLRSIGETVSNWVSQIGHCTDNILRISSSDVAAIGPMVLAQERELSAQLARIESLEAECETDNEEVQSTFTGLSNLMQLVSEHLKKSKYVRDRLQLLTFNSIVEASHLGAKADAILEISQSIKRISIDWSAMTDKSAQAMDEILSLVGQASDGMQAFSQQGCAGLEEAQAETKAGLENLRGAARFVAERAAQVEVATGKLQAKIAVVEATKAKLEASFSSTGIALSEIEEARMQLEVECPGGFKASDRKEFEALFGANYTTEMEREVLRAALSGGPLPSVQQNAMGNDVELF